MVDWNQTMVKLVFGTLMGLVSGVAGAQETGVVSVPTAPTEEVEAEVRGPTSELPYYVPVGEERLPEQAPPVAPVKPGPPEVRLALAPLMRHHVLLNGMGNYAEIGGVIRFGSAAAGLSVTGTTTGMLAFGGELPTLKGIPIYVGPVTVAFVARGFAQYTIITQGDGGTGVSAGFNPSFQVAGCQGIPWYANVGAHLTGHVVLPFDESIDPFAVGTAGIALEAGVMFF